MHGWAWRASLPFPMVEWWSWLQGSWREVAGALPVAIPLALATVVGGIDCTESASAAGDEYPTGRIIAVEGLATLVAGLFGGVIQSTPYIGHPAYKAMGARAAYTMATALFVGAAGIFGFFDVIFLVIPKAVIFPILIFIGLEITAQSFQATPIRHFPAVAMACIPALAYLAVLAVNQVLPAIGKPFDALPLRRQHWIQTVTVVAGGGTFILTSLLWSTMLAHLIDGRIKAASVRPAAGLRTAGPVRHHSLAARLVPDRDARRGDRTAPERRPIRGDRHADSLSLVGRLRGVGGRPYDPGRPGQAATRVRYRRRWQPDITCKHGVVAGSRGERRSVGLGMVFAPKRFRPESYPISTPILRSDDVRSPGISILDRAPERRRGWITQRGPDRDASARELRPGVRGCGGRVARDVRLSSSLETGLSCVKESA